MVNTVGTSSLAQNILAAKAKWSFIRFVLSTRNKSIPVPQDKQSFSWHLVLEFLTCWSYRGHWIRVDGVFNYTLVMYLTVSAGFKKKKKSYKKMFLGQTSYSVKVKVIVAQSCPTLCTRLLCPWNSPSKNTGVGYHSLLQGIFLTQGSNPRL